MRLFLDTAHLPGTCTATQWETRRGAATGKAATADAWQRRERQRTFNRPLPAIGTKRLNRNWEAYSDTTPADRQGG